MSGPAASENSKIIAQLEAELKSRNDELIRKNRALEVEVALEKVRLRTMEMRNSSELSDTSAVLYRQLKELKIHAIRTSVGIFDDPHGAVELWTTFSDQLEEIKILDYVNLHIHPILENTIGARKAKQAYVMTKLSGNQVKEYYTTMSTYLSQEQHVYNDQEYFYSFFFPDGMLNVVAYEELAQEECDIMIRFALVFGMIYTRFLDLKKSETNERNAIKQASLNRIRAEIASMRNVQDLEKITPLIWNELTTLGVPIIRCGVFIMDEQREHIHTFLSSPKGKAIAALHIPYRLPVPFFNQALEHWRKQEVYIEYWDAPSFTEFWNNLTDAGVVSEEVNVAQKAPEHLYLHLLPFLQGMLYVGNVTKFLEEDMALLQAVADAFSTAYARYDDFKMLATAKEQVEKSLQDLKLAQNQLIQSEKMASLGELTAGIAHEIQNPLNFVNNFSEVNTELIKEIQDERQKEKKLRDESLTDELLKDIHSNQEKIVQHGKRADMIVKSMLQHSRNSKHTKELTDINVLCDEYLRLAFHGLRAKDKTFNAKFETEFDTSLPKISVVPQDIGRVVLNLINNAFYAANQQRATTNEQLNPLVKITTKNLGDKIEIRVQDNGPGIPDSIKDKIFHPFFTTKPTGQGTGLGLSLSYDIVKAHGGELSVQSKENEGSEVVISLPI